MKEEEAIEGRDDHLSRLKVIHSSSRELEQKTDRQLTQVKNLLLLLEMVALSLSLSLSHLSVHIMFIDDNYTRSC